MTWGWLIVILVVASFHIRSFSQESSSIEDIQVYNNAVLLYNDAIKHQSSGKIDSAVSLYEAAIAVMEVFPQAHQNVALLYDNNDKIELARYHNQRSIQYAPNPAFKATAILNLVNMEFKLVDFKSKESLKDLISLLGECENSAACNPNLPYMPCLSL